MLQKVDSGLENFLRRKDFSRKSFLSENWEAKEQISITGPAASGTSTLYEGLKQRLSGEGYKFVSGGSIMGKIANKLGLSKAEFAKYNLDNPQFGFDEQCDSELHLAALDNPRAVIEGRFAHCAAPGACHVFVDCDPHHRKIRRFRQSLSEDRAADQAKIERELDERDKADEIRLGKLYPGCHWQPQDYDVYIDSTNKPAEEVLEIVLEKYRNWLIKYQQTSQSTAHLAQSFAFL